MRFINSKRKKINKNSGKYSGKRRVWGYSEVFHTKPFAKDFESETAVKK